MRDSVWRRSVTSSWVLIRYCGSPASLNTVIRRVRNSRSPSSVLIGMFFGEQAVLPDRGLVARDDQLCLSRIEDIRGRQSGGVLAPAIEDGLGATIGEKISSVADTLDRQRDRNIIDHQLEKFLGAFELLGKRFAVGDVIEQRDQEFRLVLFVARDHAVGGKNALFRTALDHEFVAELAIGRIERCLIR